MIFDLVVKLLLSLAAVFGGCGLYRTTVVIARKEGPRAFTHAAWGTALAVLVPTVSAIILIILQQGQWFDTPNSPAASQTSSATTAPAAPLRGTETAQSPDIVPAPSAPALPPAPDRSAETFALLGIGLVICAAAAAGLFYLAVVGIRRASVNLLRREAERARIDAERTAAAEATAAAAARRQLAWDRALTTIEATENSYAAFENDLEAVVLTRAFLGDVTAPTTAAFHTARAQALACRDKYWTYIKTHTVPATDSAVDLLADAAQNFALKYATADAHARTMYAQGRFPGGLRITRKERATLHNVIALATHPSTPEEEARAAMATARQLIRDKGIRIPKALNAPWRLALEGATLREISA